MKAISISAALIIGVVQHVFLSMCWIALGTGPLRFIISLGLTPGGFRAATTLADVVINLLFSLPAAYVLCTLRPKNLLPLYLALAVIPAMVWDYRLVLTDPPTYWVAFLPGAAINLLALPLAAVLTGRFVAARRFA